VFKSLVSDYEENLQQSKDRWEVYKALASTPEEKEIVPIYEAARKEWEAVSRKVVDGRLADTRAGRNEAMDLTIGEAKDKFENMRDQLDRLTEINLNLAQQAQTEANEAYRAMLITILTVTGIGLVVGIVLMWLVSSAITKPIKEAVDISNRMADGDMTIDIEVSRKDETGQLLAAMKNQVQRLRGVIDDVQTAANNVASGSQELSASSEEMSHD
jgi:methyl-accepting chemotaxis protein